MVRTAPHKPTNKDEVGGVMWGIIRVVYKVAQLWHSPFWG